MLKRLLSCAALACSLAIAAAVAILDNAATAMRHAAASIADFSFKVFSGPAPMVEPVDVLPERQLQRAAAFVRRLVRRDRPVLTASWRMCPSI